MYAVPLRKLRVGILIIFIYGRKAGRRHYKVTKIIAHALRRVSSIFRQALHAIRYLVTGRIAIATLRDS